MAIEVMIVEDDPMVADILRRFVSSVDGFSVVSMVSDGERALEVLEKTRARLVLLDIFMPELDGLSTLRKIRKNGVDVDVIVVSAAQEVETVNKAIRAGAFDYIVKPFVFERIRASLESLREINNRISSAPHAYTQQEIDTLFSLRNSKHYRSSLPKGLNVNTLGRIEDLLASTEHPVSAEEAAEATGVSRVTARRYLEYLVASGKAVLEYAYGEVGRPVNTYRLTGG